MNADSAYKPEDDNDTIVFDIHGDWTITRAAELEKFLSSLLHNRQDVRRVVFRCAGLNRIDTSGAWLLHRTMRALKHAGYETEFSGFREVDFQLIRHLDEICQEDDEHTEGVHVPLSARLVAIGHSTVYGVHHLGEAAGFLGRVFFTLGRCTRRPHRLRFPAIVSAMYHSGVTAIPIICLMSFMIAIVLAYQGAAQLGKFGAEVLTVQLTVVSMLREMGVLMAAIVVSGRSGSAFTAEIGVMKIRQEIDAMYTMGLDPYEVLILPRIAGLMIMLPLLTLAADLAGIMGGAVGTVFLLNMPIEAYLSDAAGVLTPSNFWAGMLKAPVFAFLIGTTATFWGMQVTGSADQVGRLTTVSVVQSLFMVIAADVLFTIIYVNSGF